jgi:hypothetical protein
VRKLTIPVVFLLALMAVAAGAAVKLPASPNLPAGWSHAQINVVLKRVPHTLTYDHGTVTSVSATALTLREPDGSVVTIAVDSSTRIMISGRRATLDQVRRLETATTVSVDGGPAAVVKVRVPPRLAAFLRREAARSARR